MFPSWIMADSCIWSSSTSSAAHVGLDAFNTGWPWNIGFISHEYCTRACFHTNNNINSNNHDKYSHSTHNRCKKKLCLISLKLMLPFQWTYTLHIRLNRCLCLRTFYSLSRMCLSFCLLLLLIFRYVSWFCRNPKKTMRSLTQKRWKTTIFTQDSFRAILIICFITFLFTIFY